LTPQLLPAVQIKSRLPMSQSSPLSIPSLALSSSQISPQVLPSSLNMNISQPLPAFHLQNEQNILLQGTNGKVLPGLTKPPSANDNTKGSSIAGNSGSSNNSSIPASSPPCSLMGSDANLMPPPPLSPPSTSPSHGTQQITQSKFIESLRETPALYDLPISELENLVAQVVSEEGFPKLVFSENLFPLKTLKNRLARKCGFDVEGERFHGDVV
jgi:hypothetical protein